MKVKCPYCDRFVTTMVGSFGFSSCNYCYREMMDGIIKRYPKEFLRIKEIINLEKEKKELVSKIIKLEEKRLNKLKGVKQ